jgi:hypothetical protein
MEKFKANRHVPANGKTYKAMKTLLLLLITVSSFAQNTLTQAEDVVLGTRALLIEEVKGAIFTWEAMHEFEKCGERCLDEYIDKAPKDWYSGIDVYISKSSEGLIKEMKTDEYAMFRSPKTRKVSVGYDYWLDGDTEIIIVFSYYR